MFSPTTTRSHEATGPFAAPGHTVPASEIFCARTDEHTLTTEVSHVWGPASLRAIYPANLLRVAGARMAT